MLFTVQTNHHCQMRQRCRSVSWQYLPPPHPPSTALVHALMFYLISSCDYSHLYVLFYWLLHCSALFLRHFSHHHHRHHRSHHRSHYLRRRCGFRYVCVVPPWTAFRLSSFHIFKPLCEPHPDTVASAPHAALPFPMTGVG